MTGDEIAFRTVDLRKRFGPFEVTRGVSIALPRGARHALIGPNGAGKTTLINLITGTLQPDGGRVELGGDDITALPAAARVRRGLSRTFQINTLFPELAPIEAVTMAVNERERTAGGFWRSLASRHDAIDEAFAILKRLRLGDVATHATRTLPYGQQRLLEIALALAARPKVLLLDEPAAGVPKDESAELFGAIVELPADVSVLFIEHDMNIVFKFASRIVVLVAGGVLMEAEPDIIRTDPRVREVYLGQAGHG